MCRSLPQGENDRWINNVDSTFRATTFTGELISTAPTNGATARTNVRRELLHHDLTKSMPTTKATLTHVAAMVMPESFGLQEVFQF